MTRIRVTLVAAALWLPGSLMAADLSAHGPHRVETIEFPDVSDASRGGAAGRTIPIKLHLPTAADTRPASGPFPIVVVSHGAGGDWDTHYAQARHLASHGYVVACLEHVGSNRQRMSQGFQLMKNLSAMIHDSTEVLGRPKDASIAIDQLEEWNRSHDKLRGRLDLEKIGMLGHSFGAFTAMVVCGMRPALDWLTPRVEPGKGLGPDLRDRRVRCGVALSPQGVGEPFFIRESFGSLQVPLLGISGTEDRQQSGLTAENRREAFALWPRGEHAFLWLANARHLDFSDSTGTDRRGLPSPTREDVQPLVRAATLLFFDAHLAGDMEAGRRLSVDGLKPYLRGSIDSVDVLAK